MISDNRDLVNEVCKYYRKNFSGGMCEAYEKFYGDKKREVIVTSAYELVSEMQGEEAAKKFLAPLIHKYKLPALW